MAGGEGIVGVLVSRMSRAGGNIGATKSQSRRPMAIRMIGAVARSGQPGLFSKMTYDRSRISPRSLIGCANVW